MNKMNKWIPIIIAAVILLTSSLVVLSFRKKSTPLSTPKPGSSVPSSAEQLPSDKQPKVILKFESDGHHVIVDFANLNADQLEYNLIYDATVKGNRIQTGVNSTAKVTGQTVFAQRQLLGSESSGKFTYHQNIKNAFMELILRDLAGRSIFTATYPFTIAPGKSITLSPSQ